MQDAQRPQASARELPFVQLGRFGHLARPTSAVYKVVDAVECLTKDREALLALLRLPGRALEASAHDQRHRKRVRDGSSWHRACQGMPLEQDRARRDLQ